MSPTPKNKTIDIHVVDKAELEGTTIKAIHKEEVVTLSYRGSVASALEAFGNAYYALVLTECPIVPHPKPILERLQNPDDKRNAYYRKISIEEAAIEKIRDCSYDLLLRKILVS